jgi:hypothetical protein
MAVRHHLEIRNRSRSAPHADLRHPVCRDSAPPTIPHHLAPISPILGSDNGKLMSTIRGNVQQGCKRRVRPATLSYYARWRTCGLSGTAPPRPALASQVWGCPGPAPRCPGPSPAVRSAGALPAQLPAQLPTCSERRRCGRRWIHAWSCPDAASRAAGPLLSDSTPKGPGFRCDPGPISRLIEPFADRSALSHWGAHIRHWGFRFAHLSIGSGWQRPLKNVVSVLAGVMC